MDLLTTLPDFPAAPYAHILPRLEKARITVKELLLLDALQVAKQTRAPVADVRKFTAHVLDALHEDLGLKAQGQASTPITRAAEAAEEAGNNDENDNIDDGDTVEFSNRPLPPPVPSHISVLDPVLDAALAGGIATGYVTELTGESGTGKTQLLLHLLLSVQLPPPIGLSKRALYISTEADLPTNRLTQLLADHTTFSELHSDIQAPSLENILSITTVDLETQDHILNYQVPIAVPRYDIGLVVIDSITANYRVESSVDSPSGLLERSWELKKLGYLLRTLAVKHNIAVVVANQVSDRFDSGFDLSFATEGLHDLPDIDPAGNTHLDSSPPPPTEPSHQPQPAINHESTQFEKDSISSVAAGVAAAEVSYHSDPFPVSHQQFDDDDNEDKPVIRIPRLDSIMNFDYQQPFLTGWGSPSSHLRSIIFNQAQDLKNPALGLVWANQIGCRIVLKFKQDRRRYGWEEPNNVVPAILPEPTPSDDKDIPAVTTLDEDGAATPVLSKDTIQEAHGNQDGGTSIPASPDNNTNHQETPTAQPKLPEVDLEVGDDMTPVTLQSGTRRRQMQVVFSPWTAGILYQQDDDDPNNTTSPLEPDSMYDPVEYEILPHGIRGIL